MVSVHAYSYRFRYVYRNEKPGPGRFRQFMQFDADTVGSATMAADAELRDAGSRHDGGAGHFAWPVTW